MIINLLNWFPWVRWMINKYVWCRWPYRNNRNVLYFVFERVSEWFYRGSSQLFDYDLWDQSMLCIRLRVWSRPRFIDSFDSHYSKLSDIDLQNREYIYILALVSKFCMVIHSMTEHRLIQFKSFMLTSARFISCHKRLSPPRLPVT